MIITDKFAWFHIGKTGGDHFSYLLNKYYQDKITFQHHSTDPKKHLSIDLAKEEFSAIIDGLPYVINYRKLCSWLISWNRHHFRWLYYYLDTEIERNRIFHFVNKQTKSGRTVIPSSGELGLSIQHLKNANEKIIKYTSQIFTDQKHWHEVTDNDSCFFYVEKLSDNKDLHIIKQENLTMDFYSLMKFFFEDKPEILNDNSITNTNTTFPKIELSEKEIKNIYEKNSKRYKLDCDIYSCDVLAYPF